MEIKNAKFIVSVASKDKILQDDLPEIAFVGRSNVGKSSIINSLANVNGLAKTSSTPGRTRLINYFSMNNNTFKFVDLPGYGFAKASKQHKKLWSTLIEDYLVASKNLKLIILLVDIRHAPNEYDQLMQNYLFTQGIPCIVVATKADKVAKSKIVNYKKVIASTLKVGLGNIYHYSAVNSYGKKELLDLMEHYLRLAPLN